MSYTKDSWMKMSLTQEKHQLWKHYGNIKLKYTQNSEANIFIAHLLWQIPWTDYYFLTTFSHAHLWLSIHFTFLCWNLRKMLSQTVFNPHASIAAIFISKSPTTTTTRSSIMANNIIEEQIFSCWKKCSLHMIIHKWYSYRQ